MALSYTWGVGASSLAIELNGASFSVGLNLFCLLVDLQKRFRLGHRFGESLRAVSPSRDASRKDTVASSRLVEEGRIVKTQCTLRNLFWIDAICINQDDMLERGHQVGFMRDIYSTADFVMAWLGRGDPAIVDPALDMITDERSESRNPSTFSRAAAPAAAAFFERPSWDRMWIIPEFILPEKLFILWGSEGLWWGDLLFWLDTTVYTGELFGLPGFRKVKHLCLHKYRQPRYMKGILPTTSLNDLIAAFGYGLCADPRDRVFSLLGLVNCEGPSKVDTVTW